MAALTADQYDRVMGYVPDSTEGTIMRELIDIFYTADPLDPDVIQKANSNFDTYKGKSDAWRQTFRVMVYGGEPTGAAMTKANNLTGET